MKGQSLQSLFLEIHLSISTHVRKLSLLTDIRNVQVIYMYFVAVLIFRKEGLTFVYITTL